MKEQAPPFKLYHEDGTSGNYIKIGQRVPQYKILEKYSGMKYGRHDVDIRTFNMLEAIAARTTDTSIFPEIILAAESVLVDCYVKRDEALTLYDVDNEEEVVYIFDPNGPKYDYIARVTKMIQAKLYETDYTAERLFVGASIDYPSLIENLKFERDWSAQVEDYQNAISFRDIISAIEEKIDDDTQSETVT